MLHFLYVHVFIYLTAYSKHYCPDIHSAPVLDASSLAAGQFECFHDTIYTVYEGWYTDGAGIINRIVM